MALTVAIDGRALVDASSRRGVGMYVRQMVQGLAGRAEIDPVVLVRGDPHLDARIGRVELPRLLPALPVPSNRARLALQRWEIDRVLSRAMATVDADVYFSPGQDPPRRSPLPVVQTVQDLTTFLYRDPRHDDDRRRWERAAPRVRACAAVVTPSRSSRDAVVGLLGVDEHKVHVVPLGVGPQFVPGPGRSPSAPPYIVYVSAWGPHKGFTEASRVAATLARLGYPHRVVVAGPMDEFMRRCAAADVATGGGGDAVELRGYVDDLVTLYRDAAVAICPSRAEGFGLPVLEAMASGTPVVAFTNTSLPDVVGDGGVVVPDGDVDAMVEAVCTLLDDHDARDEASARAQQWAARFTWESSVAAHVRIFELVAPVRL